MKRCGSRFGHWETQKQCFRDLLKIFGLCKMIWIAKNVCDTVN